MFFYTEVTKIHNTGGGPQCMQVLFTSPEFNGGLQVLFT